MQSTVFCIVGLIAAGGSAMFSGSPAGPVNSWVDTSKCSPGDTPPMCQYRKTQCSHVRKPFMGPKGPVRSVITCANMSGLVTGLDFYRTIGPAFTKGIPEKLADQVTADPEASLAIRRCTLNTTGLLNPDYSVNRDALAMSLNASFTDPSLAAASMGAAYTCIEPADFMTTTFINCIRSACMSNVNMTSLVAPSSLYGGPSGPSGSWAGGPSGPKPWEVYAGAP